MTTSRQLRRNRDFVLFTTGRLLSAGGTSLTSIAYPLLVLELTHSPAKAGLVSFARLLPIPIFSLAAGLVADRHDRRRLMIGADAIRAVALASLAVLVLVHPLFWPILVVAFIEGAGDTFFNAAQVGALRSVVATEQLPDALAVGQAQSATVSVAGPPVGGALFSIGHAVPFVVDAASYVASSCSLLAMRRRFQAAREHETSSVRARLAAGFRYIWADRYLRDTTFLYAVGNVTIPGLLLILVVVARGQGFTGGEVGLLVAAFGGSIFVGATLSGRARKRFAARTIALAEFYLGLGVVLFLVWPNVFVLAAAVVLQGLVLPITDSVVHGYRIARTPEHLLGRVEAARSLLARAAQPLGPLLAGFLISSYSARTSVAVFAALSAVLAVAGTSSRGLRERPIRG